MAAQNKFLFKMFLSGTIQGWSESYYLKGTTKTAALAQAATLVTARKAMLHESITLDYAMVSDIGVNRDSYIAISSPQEGDSTVTTWSPNRLQDAILLRQQTATGKVSNRYIHGVPDGVIINQRYDPTALAGAWDTVLNAYITALKDNTAYLSKTGPSGSETFTLSDWDQVVQRGATEHKVGRPFELHPGRRRPA